MSLFRIGFCLIVVRGRVGWRKVVKWSLMSFIMTPEVKDKFLELVKIWSIKGNFIIKDTGCFVNCLDESILHSIFYKVGGCRGEVKLEEVNVGVGENKGVMVG